MDYKITFRGRRGAVTANDELEAAKRFVCNELMEDRLPRGASYELMVNGRAVVVDVAMTVGRGSTVARYA